MDVERKRSVDQVDVAVIARDPVPWARIAKDLHYCCLFRFSVSIDLMDTMFSDIRAFMPVNSLRVKSKSRYMHVYIRLLLSTFVFITTVSCVKQNLSRSSTKHKSKISLAHPSVIGSMNDIIWNICDIICQWNHVKSPTAPKQRYNLRH